MQHKREVRYLPGRELRIATVADGTKTLSGYAIVWNVRSLDLGGFTEVVSPDAVTDTLKGKPDILCLNSHDNTLVLGRTTSGTLQLSPDSVGLRFICSLDTRSTQANDLAISVERGDVSGCSFGFRTLKDAWTNEGNDVQRTLLQVELFEISICSNPAYPQTDVNIRSCPAELRKRLTRSYDDDLDGDDDECECNCPECEDGDCANCSNSDCTDPNCEHGEDSARCLFLSALNIRIALSQRL